MKSSVEAYPTPDSENDREFGKGIEAYPAPDMSKQLEAL
jgi:hypothetical protein